MGLSLSVDDVKDKAEPEPAGQQAAEPEPASQGSGNFMGNLSENLRYINQILQQVNNIKSNPVVRQFLANKVGAKLDQQGSQQGQQQTLGNKSDSDQSKQQPEGDNSSISGDQVYSAIMQGIKWVANKHDKGQEATLGEVKQLMLKNEQEVKQGLDQVVG